MFEKAVRAGVFATVKNPSNSYFWQTDWVLRLMRSCRFFVADFQACMLGGARNKWTRLVASFPEIRQLCIACDKSHRHEPWRFAKDSSGNRVWAISLESQYPHKMCVALVQCILQAAHQQGLTLQPQSLQEIHDHPLLKAQAAQVSSGLQPRRKVPHLVPDFQATASFLTPSLAQVPCALLQKLPKPAALFTLDFNRVQVPTGARFLRFSSFSSSPGGERQASKGGLEWSECFKVVFGLPWSVRLDWTEGQTPSFLQ